MAAHHVLVERVPEALVNCWVPLSVISKAMSLATWNMVR